MGFSSFVVIEKIYSCLFTVNKIMLLPIYKISFFFNNLFRRFFPKLSSTQTLPINNIHFVFASVINLICFSWLVDRLHFLSC